MQTTLHMLDLHMTSPDQAKLFSDEQVVLSEKKVALATLKEEKLLDRSEKLGRLAGIMGKSSQATKEEIKNAWAFAVSPVSRKRTSMQVRNKAIITSVSREAKKFGIQAGMRYEEAKQLLPEVRILVYGRV